MATILIAEDDVDIAAVLNRLLTRAGYQVSVTADGRVALDAARTLRPDVIVTDMDMPYLDGLGLCRAVRADPVLQGTPVVIVTGGLLPGDPRTQQAGACGVLLKPFTTARLMAVVRRLTGTGAHDHLPATPCAADFAEAGCS